MAQRRRLIGSELLEAVAAMPDASKSEKARACGYVTEAEDGTERLAYASFYEALAVASGVNVEPERKPRLRYQASVLTTGAILIGARYAEQLGLAPGDKVDLNLNPSGILVRPSGSTR